ncbi:hypothetical protein ACFL5E_01115 [Candidatus Omnitrophota bacterium]
MKDALKKLLQDKLSRDILSFFYENPTSVDSVGGISAWVGESRKKVLSSLEKLVELGVLSKDSEEGAKGYGYTRDEEIMEIIEELMQDAKA